MKLYSLLFVENKAFKKDRQPNSAPTIRRQHFGTQSTFNHNKPSVEHSSFSRVNPACARVGIGQPLLCTCFSSVSPRVCLERGVPLSRHRVFPRVPMIGLKTNLFLLFSHPYFGPPSRPPSATLLSSSFFFFLFFLMLILLLLLLTSPLGLPLRLFLDSLSPTFSLLFPSLFLVLLFQRKQVDGNSTADAFSLSVSLSVRLFLAVPLCLSLSFLPSASL